jgi:transposase
MAEKPLLIDMLLEKLAELEAEIQGLKAENAELGRRLEMNSQNSYKPLSSDGYRKKLVQPAFPKTDKRAPGGKMGHKGKTLRQVEKPDKVDLHLPKELRCAAEHLWQKKNIRWLGRDKFLTC